MLKRAIIIQLLLILTFQKAVAANVRDSSINMNLLKFGFFQNWADTLTILGIDMLTDIYHEQLSNFDQTDSRHSEKIVFQEAFREEKKSFSLKKLFHIDIKKTTYFTLFKSAAGISFHGISYFLKSENRSGVEHSNYLITKAGKLKEQVITKKIMLLKESERGLYGFSEDLKKLCFFNPDLSLKKEIVLAGSFIPRDVWELSGQRVLLSEYPFQGHGYLFSVIDAEGKVVDRFFIVFSGRDYTLRKYFIRNFITGAIEREVLCFTPVFPADEYLNIYMVDLKTRLVSGLRGELEKFPGQDPRFDRQGILSVKKGKIAAVNGIFTDRKDIFVSLAINNLNESCQYYLYIFNTGKRNYQVIEVPFGAVIYYDRTDRSFVAFETHKQKEAEYFRFTLFEVKK